MCLSLCCLIIANVTIAILKQRLMKKEKAVSWTQETSGENESGHPEFGNRMIRLRHNICQNVTYLANEIGKDSIKLENMLLGKNISLRIYN